MSATKNEELEEANVDSNPLEETSVTMLDVLEQENELEQEYAAVLGGSDEKSCTYTKGPIKRQALYSCLTCCPEARDDLSKAAGICLACSYRCHENHVLIELYTKRNFRCDCPTTRIGTGSRCALNSELDGQQPPNESNEYNQNFQGVYCKCKRPYPDPERKSEELMLQCAVCEDWYHLSHMDVPAGASKLVDACSEMICDDCMDRHPFLRDYSGFALEAVDDLNEEPTNITQTGDVSVCEDNDNKLKSELDKSIADIMNINESSELAEDEDKPKGSIDNKQEIEETDDVVEPPCKRVKADEETDVPDKVVVNKPTEGCRRPVAKDTNKKGATFWGHDLRTSLCQCVDCMAMYKREQIEFLLDTEDSSMTYEERGMKRAAENSTYEQGIRALATIGHTQQIDAITEYNRMKDKLKEYLQSFVASKKVVTEEDINRFFENMRNEKNANLGQPYLCR